MVKISTTKKLSRFMMNCIIDGVLFIWWLILYYFYLYAWCSITWFLNSWMKLFIYLLLNWSSFFFLSIKLLFFHAMPFFEICRNIQNIKYRMKRYIVSLENYFSCKLYLPIYYILFSNVINNFASTLRQLE